MESVYTRDLKSLALRACGFESRLSYQYRKKMFWIKKFVNRLDGSRREPNDLNALVDTLQATLRRADSVIKDEEDRKYVFTHAGKWAINAKI